MAQIFKNLPEFSSVAVTTTAQPEAETAGQDARLLALQAQLLECQQQLQSMRGSVETLRSQARQEGYSDGFLEGQSAGQASVTKDRMQLERLLGSLNATMLKPLEDTEGVMVELVMAAIARLMGKHMTDRRHAIEVVKQALQSYVGQHVTCLHVSVDDYDYLRTSDIDFNAFPQLRVIASPKIELGGCLIETENGFADARLETQLGRIREILLHALHSASSGGSHAA